MATNLNMSADDHKMLGNKLFQAKDYESAIKEYSTAIVKDPTIAIYYSNRANCYLKLGKLENVINDCEKVVQLDPTSFKGYYFKGQAQLELERPDEAVSCLKKAYNLALEQKSPTAGDIVLAILKGKKLKWLQSERQRIADASETYRYLKGLIEADMEKERQEIDTTSEYYEDDLSYWRAERERKLGQLERMLAKASVPDPDSGLPRRQDSTTETTTTLPSPTKSNEDEQSSERYEAPRYVPDYFVDKISFHLMQDPVITKSGVSYERASVQEHFQKVGYFDPITRQAMNSSDLIPNLALRESIEEFLNHNGWAVDY